MTELPTAPGEQGIDLSSYGKIELDANRIEVSGTFKGTGDVFKEIRFNPKGFQEYHMSLDF